MLVSLTPGCSLHCLHAIEAALFVFSMENLGAAVFACAVRE